MCSYQWLLCAIVSLTTSVALSIPLTGQQNGAHGSEATSGQVGHESDHSRHLVNIDLAGGLGHAETVAGHGSPKLMTLDVSILRDPEPIILPSSTRDWADGQYYSGGLSPASEEVFDSYEDPYDVQDDGHFSPVSGHDEFELTNKWPALPARLGPAHVFDHDEEDNSLTPLPNYFLPKSHHGVYPRSQQLMQLSTGNDALSDFLDSLTSDPYGRNQHPKWSPSSRRQSQLRPLSAAFPGPQFGESRAQMGQGSFGHQAEVSGPEVAASGQPSGQPESADDFFGRFAKRAHWPTAILNQRGPGGKMASALAPLSRTGTGKTTQNGWLRNYMQHILSNARQTSNLYNSVRQSRDDPSASSGQGMPQRSSSSSKKISNAG
ncbi:hypothetical protein HDE_01512 [Halotydeus destructor]|nr:hypothetical protein HDE_01512 [Halotydeus destructor]